MQTQSNPNWVLHYSLRTRQRCGNSPLGKIWRARVKYSDSRTNLANLSESRHGLAVGERDPASPLQLKPAVTPATKRYHKCSSMLHLPAALYGQNPLLNPGCLETQQQGIIHKQRPVGNVIFLTIHR